jgi:hypothetical protein
MRAAFYWWSSVRGRSWRQVLTVLLVGGLLGAAALGAVAGARRTWSAYGRYLTSTNVSDAFVNVPGALPGMAPTRPITLISKLPGIAASAAYLGLDDNPVVHGRIDDSHLASGLIGSYTGSFFSQDRMTVLAGRLPAVSSTGQIALTPRIASLFGVGVGGTVTYAFSKTFGPPGARPVLHSFKVTAIVDVPPVLVDSSDQSNIGVLPPGATRRLRARLIRTITAANPDGTPGGTYELQLDRALAAEIVNASQMSGQPLALALGVAAAAMVSLALTVLTSVRRRRRDLALLKTLGMTRGQVRSVVAWQTSVILIIAALIGVPLGVAAGRWTWTAFANSIGVVPATVVPATAMVLGLLGLLAAGNLLAAWPAAVAARITPAAALRAE